MKTIGFCVLLSMLSIAAYSGMSDPLGQPLSATPASPWVAPGPPSLSTSGAIAADATSGRPRHANKLAAWPVQRSTTDRNNLAANLSEYVLLHKTRNENVAAHPGTRACPE